MARDKKADVKEYIEILDAILEKVVRTNEDWYAYWAFRHGIEGQMEGHHIGLDASGKHYLK